MSRLKERFEREVAPALREQLGLKNIWAVPRLEKIVISSGVGRAAQNSQALAGVTENLAKVSGQRPIVTRARKSIAGFKLREGVPIGAKVTLRGERMYEFLDRLIQVALPRVRDFRGLSPQALDPQGNYSIGISEITVFPEAADVELGEVHGVEVTLVTTARNEREGEALLRSLGLPIRETATTREEK